MSRYGFLILIALLYFGRGVLDVWMKPATMATSLLLGSVDHLVLPTASALMR